MRTEDRDLILRVCGASSLRVGAKIQSLWSGYGEIVRLHLQGSGHATVVVKHVKFPQHVAPRGGGNTDRSHARKVRSYQVETYWYQNYSTSQDCRIPSSLAACSHGDEMLIVLEDLDAAGYNQRRTTLTDSEIRMCLRWLAQFHALFLGVTPAGLWPVGTYWHLETRPDELDVMEDSELKAAAAEIDRRLSACRFLTIVHGDAKLANFCFSSSSQQVAAVDFQYVGGGCGMKDVVYFLGSCLEERQCEKKVPALLDFYFSELKKSVKPGVDFPALEDEWRAMFALAWTDFHRFLLGWMPGHWKVNSYSKRLCKEVLSGLQV
ncbi:uncharacterized protein pkdc [Synchiropus picturatus]